MREQHLRSCSAASSSFLEFLHSKTMSCHLHTAIQCKLYNMCIVYVCAYVHVLNGGLVSTREAAHPGVAYMGTWVVSLSGVEFVE